MKKLSKIVSLILALSVVISCFGVVTASADTAATLIYDMDLSNYATNGTIANSVSGSNLNFAISKGTLHNVSAARFISESRKEVPYIAMPKSNSKLQMTTTDSDMLAQSYTLEAWIQKKHTGTINNVIFMEIFPNDTAGTSGKTTNANVSLATYGLTDKVSASSGETSAQLGWASGVTWISKKYDDDAFMKITLVREVINDTETSTYKVNKRLYINGLGYHDRNNTAFAEQTYTLSEAYTETSVGFSLGCVSAMEEFNIADVKVYRGALTADEIKTNYADEKSDFNALSDEELLVYDMDLSSFSAQDTEIANSVEGGKALTVTKDSSGSYGKESFLNGSNTKIPYIAMKSNNTILSLEDSSLAGKTLTLEAWVNLRMNTGRSEVVSVYGKDANSEIVNKALLGSGYIDFASEPRYSQWVLYNNNYSSFYSYSPKSTHMKQDTWIHIAAVRDMTVSGKVTETYYFNGVKGATYTYETTSTDILAGFFIKGGGEPQFNVADIKVYEDKVFTESEVDEHYEAEKAIYTQAIGLVDADSSYRIRDGEGNAIKNDATKLAAGFNFHIGINVAKDGVVIVALYNGNDMVGAKAVPVTTSTTSPLKVAFDGITYDSSAKYTIKAFTLDGTDTLTPYAPAKSYNFK